MEPYNLTTLPTDENLDLLQRLTSKLIAYRVGVKATHSDHYKTTSLTIYCQTDEQFAGIKNQLRIEVGGNF